jgi:hypothetical protein
MDVTVAIAVSASLTSLNKMRMKVCRRTSVSLYINFILSKKKKKARLTLYKRKEREL